MEYDLFNYPQTPGHRGIDTQIEAAKKVESGALKWKCYRDIKDYLERCGEMGATTYEMADMLNYKHSFLQPRVSELLLKEEIHYGGARRPNKDGNSARVYIFHNPTR